MSLPINLTDLIHQRKVERTRIEYKADWNPEPIIHTITAFANDFDNMGGGYVLIGVEEEDGRPKLPIKGIDPESIDAIQLDLLNKCNFIEKGARETSAGAKPRRKSRHSDQNKNLAISMIAGFLLEISTVFGL